MEQFRPFPATDLIDQAEEEEAIRLAPAPELKEWVVNNWLTLGGELHNPDHDHIAELLHDNEEFLAFAWASSAAVAKKRMVLGQCEKVMFNQGGWKKARQEQQMRDWFGFVPQYLITVDNYRKTWKPYEAMMEIAIESAIDEASKAIEKYKKNTYKELRT